MRVLKISELPKCGKNLRQLFGRGAFPFSGYIMARLNVLESARFNLTEQTQVGKLPDAQTQVFEAIFKIGVKSQS
jgi:hypothetical protein